MSEESVWTGDLTGCIRLTGDAGICQVNDAAVRWLGYAREELVGRPLHSFLGGGGQLFVHSQILPVLRLQGRLEEIYLRLTEKSGASLTILANFAQLPESRGGGIEFSFMRIPQRGKLEDELLQARKLAEQASDAKTKFLGMISHEVRTPLQAISFNNQMLLRGEFGPLTPEIKMVAESSQESVNTVVVLIDDILNFASMRSGGVEMRLEDFPAGRALNRAEVGLRHRFQEAGLHFERDKSADDLLVRADPDRLQQILINLINNAVKFTPRSGTITLAARPVGTFVAFDVNDTGCGIPADQLQRVFEPFVQLRTAIKSTDTPGVGLGLAICRDLIQAMGGRIEVQSVVGAGSRFSVFLPRPS